MVRRTVIALLFLVAVGVSCQPTPSTYDENHDVTRHYVLTTQTVDKAGNPTSSVVGGEVASLRFKASNPPTGDEVVVDTSNGLSVKVQGKSVAVPFDHTVYGGSPSAFGGITVFAEQWDWDWLLQRRFFTWKSAMTWYWAYGRAVIHQPAAPDPTPWSQGIPGCALLACAANLGQAFVVNGYYAYNFYDGGFWPQGGYEAWMVVTYAACPKINFGGVGCFPAHSMRNDIFGHGDGTWTVRYKTLY